MMKTKTLVTTMGLTGALLASASVAKANAFLEIFTTGFAPATMSGPGVGTITSLTATVGPWTVVSESGNPTAGPFNVDLSITGNDMPETNPLWVLYSVNNIGGPISGPFDLNTDSNGENTKTVNDWVYNLYVGAVKNPLGDTGTLAPANAFASQSIGNNSFANTVGSVVNLTAFTELVEILPGKGANKLSIDSNFTAVPDGGTTLMLLGSALTGLAGLRSKFGFKRA
jgi:hypothetical protein